MNAAQRARSVLLETNAWGSIRQILRSSGSPVRLNKCAAAACMRGKARSRRGGSKGGSGPQGTRGTSAPQRRRRAPPSSPTHPKAARARAAPAPHHRADWGRRRDPADAGPFAATVRPTEGAAASPALAAIRLSAGDRPLIGALPSFPSRLDGSSRGDAAVRGLLRRSSKPPPSIGHALLPWAAAVLVTKVSSV